MDRTALAIAAAIAIFAATADARIKRSGAARTAFARAVACPSTGLNKLPCPGYVIDHVKPLACGGADAPHNMQWLDVAAWFAKSKWERKAPGCR